MNYNSLANRDYELYNNFETTDIGGNPLINTRVNDYFNDILNQPEPPRNYSIVTKSDYTWSKFYKDYIEHNMLFIVILIGIAIFLVIRYYSMDYDPKNSDDTTDIDNLDDSDLETTKGKKKYKKQLKKYKKQLDEEKKKILDVIDELSSINYEEQKYYTSKELNYQNEIQKLMQYQKMKEMQDIEDINQLKELQAQLAHGNNTPFAKAQGTNQSGNSAQLAQLSQSQSNNQQAKSAKKFVEPDRHVLDLTIKNNDTTDSDDNSNYYNLKNYNKKNKDDFISDFYIEPPYN